MDDLNSFFPIEWHNRTSHPNLDVLFNPNLDAFLMTTITSIFGCYIHSIFGCYDSNLLSIHNTMSYGFEVLQRCESPRHPFRIFKSRFSRPPQLIIYDNACRLHVYCLNREPQFFKGTRFAVDRFHWRGHVGCSKGYSLDAYIDR